MSNLQSFSDDDLGGAHGPNRVVLLYGGRSSEHAISCVSAAAVLRGRGFTVKEVKEYLNLHAKVSTLVGYEIT